MKIRKMAFALIMLCCFIPSAGFAATQTYTFVNNCTAPVTVTINQYPMTLSGEVRGGVQTRTVGPINAGGTASVNRPQGNLVPLQIDAAYAGTQQTSVFPIRCSGTPEQCIQSFTVTFKMNGTLCVMSSDQSVWAVSF